MNNTINVNYMSNVMNQFSNLVVKDTGKKESSFTFQDTIEKAEAANVSELAETSEVETKPKEDMTLEEYREMISEKIAGFPLHPSQVGNSFAINISDASLQKMKDDPEYEEWLLNDVKSALGSAVPGWYQAIGGPNTYCVLNYENGEKGCWCHMWSKDYKGGSKSASDMFDEESENSIHRRKDEESWWEKRIKLHKLYLKQAQAWQDKSENLQVAQSTKATTSTIASKGVSQIADGQLNALDDMAKASPAAVFLMMMAMEMNDK